MRRLAHVVDGAAEPGAPLDVLHLGGGALTLPRYVAATRPAHGRTWSTRTGGCWGWSGSICRCPTSAASPCTRPTPGRGWKRQPRVRRPSDRGCLRRLPGSGAPHVRRVRAGGRAALRADGIYAANLADSAPFAFLRSQSANFAAVFPELALVGEPAVLRGRRFGNVVLLASYTPIDVDPLVRRCAADAFPARVTHGGALTRFIGGARPVADADAVASPEPPDGAFSVG